MDVTYIEHSSFVIDVGTHYLLFDYVQGTLPPLEKKPLYMFVSHHHSDHYSDRIFHLTHTDEIHYILSDDISKADVPSQLFIHWVEPYQTLQVDSMQISTLKSTDEGVAFVIQTEGKTIYYAGDLNNWFWEEEGDSYTQEMSISYHKELDLLPKHIDLAFVVADQRLGKHYAKGVIDLLEKVEVDTLFPMHMGDDTHISTALAQKLDLFPTKSMLINHTGQTWRNV